MFRSVCIVEFVTSKRVSEGFPGCRVKGQFLTDVSGCEGGRRTTEKRCRVLVGRLDHHRIWQINFPGRRKRKKADRINLMPMAFFRERGFSGTRSNLRARFSGEPPSLSEIRSFLKATFWAQGSHSEPKSLSKEIDSTARAKKAVS
jgi:hypothetical protein